jgi:hypothetical protein
MKALKLSIGPVTEKMVYGALLRTIKSPEALKMIAEDEEFILSFKRSKDLRGEEFEK